jgi:2-dehydropantoate 2-reductase
MRMLIVGAGATGGYFGGRLLEAGRDVTFLVRERRAARLAASGLVIKSPAGDVVLANPPTVTADRLEQPYDLILLSCKSYDLDNAIESFAPAVGPQTMILPVLNGMRHLDVLDARFGAARVLGGLCMIASTLDDEQAILHLNDTQILTFGERGGAANGTENGALSPRVKALAEQMKGAKFTVRASDAIMMGMWEKWVFLASLAAGSCLMRAPVGDIESAPGGVDLILGLFDECRAVAERAGFAPRPEFVERTRVTLTTKKSSFTASMLRDIERGAPIEADHVIGDLIQRAGAGASVPLLRVAYAHLKAYEARRAREHAGA